MMFVNGIAKNFPLVNPSDILETKMQDVILPIIQYIRDRYTQKGLAVTFGSPDIMNQSDL
jgi:hypothetical protein